ncbi:MAG: cache domain-containing protein [Proteobacteria bacterium]|nr:cache domain-containing protein [Pseudomonadota bacterium]
MSGPLQNLSIRSKLLLGYFFSFLVALILGGLMQYVIVRSTLTETIEQELQTSTTSILRLVKTVTDASIRNHLRAIAEKNRDILAGFHARTLTGELTKAEAQSAATKVLLSQTIGTTGYIYCINSDGIVQVHPQKALLGQDISDNVFVQLQKERRVGYLEYDWNNPDEAISRPKALYMTYFEPWDWILSASSYRDEFTSLFNLDELRDDIRSITFGKTGYSYVMDSNGTLIIHPTLEGTNIYDSTDSSGRRFIEEVCREKNGKIIYPWQNPGETEPREKLVIFNYIPEFDWIIASSSYLEEFYQPLRTLATATLLMAALLAALLLPLTWWIANSISKPVKTLAAGFEQGAEGNYSGRIDTQQGGELGELANYYNIFMTKLEKSRHHLQLSEEKYRSIFENAVEGIFQSTAEGIILDANPSLARMLGFDNQTSLVEYVADLGNQLYVNPERRIELLQQLSEHGTVFGFEAQLRRLDGSSIWASINSRASLDEKGNIVHMEGSITDITRRKESEMAVHEAKTELEQRVDERTSELSRYVHRLEARNKERALLQEMGTLVQLCHSQTETFPVVRRFMGQFFPDDTVSLFIFNKSTSELEPVFQGDTSAPFLADECWGLRQGKPYLLDTTNQRPPCAHLGNMTTNGSLCAPLTTQNELIGLLLVQFQTPMGSPERLMSRSSVLRLASSITENLALTISNLGLRESLRLQSILDPLTGLYNRRYMDEVMNRELARATRRKHSVAVLMLDLDHFKQFNDTFGHDAGDLALTELAAFLRVKIRGEDVPCRYGGEEFALILNEVTEETALAKAQELCDGIRDSLRIKLDGSEERITASIGVALFPQHGRDAETVLKAADEALYAAKGAGRDQVALYG